MYTITSILTPTLPLLLSLTTLINAQSTVTLTAAATTTAASAQYTSDSAFQSAILDATNFYRKEHNATALTWNDTSAAYATKWAEPCEFKHSGGTTGENLAAGYANATDSIIAWGSERSSYSFSDAQFSEATGHFTQLVWKATTSVGCGRKECDGENNTPGWYVVCEYYPPGNVVGSFKDNVQSQVEGSASDNPITGEVSGAVGGGSRCRSLVALVVGAIFITAALW